MKEMPSVNMTINSETGGTSSALSVTEITVRGFHVDVFGVVNHAWCLHFFKEIRRNKTAGTHWKQSQVIVIRRLETRCGRGTLPQSYILTSMQRLTRGMISIKAARAQNMQGPRPLAAEACRLSTRQLGLLSRTGIK
jgi:hypothetical protein